MDNDLLRAYCNVAIAWEIVPDGPFMYHAKGLNGESLGLVIGEFPDEDLWHLFCNDQYLGALNDWPPSWQRPKTTS